MTGRRGFWSIKWETQAGPPASLNSPSHQCDKSSLFYTVIYSEINVSSHFKISGVRMLLIVNVILQLIGSVFFPS